MTKTARANGPLSQPHIPVHRTVMSSPAPSSHGIRATRRTPTITSLGPTSVLSPHRLRSRHAS
ncbi:hypothetical protein E2562_029430 [Oryza meyeriana var. granulata]|uniref:Uncharacterized protein n=1 Tax=Oryza meyeriana var. granulata TaxID=110450 RepID=A0A6G1C0V4_9ORYZ|nr:hypothetical protein E2562_029430 [Oryza meyeriana var. granulata]